MMNRMFVPSIRATNEGGPDRHGRQSFSYGVQAVWMSTFWPVRRSLAGTLAPLFAAGNPSVTSTFTMGGRAKTICCGQEIDPVAPLAAVEAPTTEHGRAIAFVRVQLVGNVR